MPVSISPDFPVIPEESKSAAMKRKNLRHFIVSAPVLAANSQSTKQFGVLLLHYAQYYGKRPCLLFQATKLAFLSYNAVVTLLAIKSAFHVAKGFDRRKL